jgi:hypothetical protein
MPCITTRRPQYVLHGTLTTFRRRCGKPTCRCATGDPHETPAFVYTEGGRSKTLTLREDEVAEVAAALARYEAARDDLESAAREALAALKQRRSRERGRS